MWLVNNSFNNIKGAWSRLSKAREYNEGAHIKPNDYNYIPFENNYNKLVSMFQLRLYHVNNTPYMFHSDKLTGQMANLHKEINYLQSRLFFKRVLLIYAILGIYSMFHEEESKDWGDKFDLKFMVTAYGQFEESTADGTESLDQ